MENTPKFTPETIFIEYDALGKLIDLPAEQFDAEFAKPMSLSITRTVAHDMGIDRGSNEYTTLHDEVELGFMTLYKSKKLEALYNEASPLVLNEGRNLVQFVFKEHDIVVRVVGVVDATTQNELCSTTLESYR